jgi:hypothetical protein
MDIEKLIRELEEEREQIDRAISVLEGISTASAAPTARRGRKSMSDAERKAVSKRMRDYWAKRRREQKRES